MRGESGIAVAIGSSRAIRGGTAMIDDRFYRLYQIEHPAAHTRRAGRELPPIECADCTESDGGSGITGTNDRW